MFWFNVLTAMTVIGFHFEFLPHDLVVTGICSVMHQMRYTGQLVVVTSFENSATCKLELGTCF
jgi:hypothetical protein